MSYLERHRVLSGDASCLIWSGIVSYLELHRVLSGAASCLIWSCIVSYLELHRVISDIILVLRVICKFTFRLQFVWDYHLSATENILRI